MIDTRDALCTEDRQPGHAAIMFLLPVSLTCLQSIAMSLGAVNPLMWLAVEYQ